MVARKQTKGSNPKPTLPTYPGPAIDAQGIASSETLSAVCRYITYRWLRLDPRPRYDSTNSLVDPYGTLITGPDLNDLTQRGGYGSGDPGEIAAFEATYPNVKDAFDAWAAWAATV